MTALNAPLSLNLEWLSNYMPGAFLWKKDRNSVYMEINKACADLFDLPKKRDISGFTDSEIPCGISEFADIFVEQDRQVMETREPLKILEIHPCAKQQWKVMLNTKNPLLDSQGEVVGTFAVCLDLTREIGEISRLLSALEMHHYVEGRLVQGSYRLQQHNSDVNLTGRQAECLFYLIRGKTFKEIGKILKISPRTVEDHIEQLKIRFSSQTKAEVIDKAMQQGFMNIIPQSLLQRRLSQSLSA